MDLLGELAAIPGSAFAPVREPLFHYTDAAGLLGIVRGRELWVSEAASMNDRAEIRQGWSALRSQVLSLPHAKGREILESFLSIRTFDSDPHEVFVLCASRSGDDANQWRLYGGGGRGYAIELDPAVALAVTSRADPTKPDSAPGAFSWARYVADTTEISPWLGVLYGEDQVRDALAELARCAADCSAWIDAQDADDQERDSLYEDLQEEITQALTTIAHLYKTPGFIGEQEVRLVARVGLRGTKHVQFRPGAYGLTAYVTMAAATGSSDSVQFVTSESPPGARPPIKSVRLGPLLDPDNKTTVETLLRQQNQRGLDVTTSTVPLR